MSVQLPDFRNLFTTGNVISTVSAAFICGMAWMNVQGTQGSQSERLTKVEKSEQRLIESVQTIKEGVATINANQVNQNRSIEEIKDWLKTITRQTK
jgi:hypothetical protein